jgi:manganese/zinc/iron transport system ATP- binding protein
MGDPAIILDDVSIAYNGAPVLEHVTLTIPRGQLVGIIGPNGAGKSTLLKGLAGLLHICCGHVLVGGLPPKQAHHLVAYIPQHESVDWNFPATVADIVMMGRFARLGWLRWPGRADYAAVDRALVQVGLQDIRHRLIGELSGGQQQRVFLARALVQEAPIVLMDEPFSGVDASTEESMFRLLRTARQDGKTILVATHDLSSALQLFDLLIFLNRRLIAYGPADRVFTSEILEQTYGSHLLRWVAGETVVVMDEGGHH